MASLTYRMTILGCRVNHAEARDFESILLDRGLIPALENRQADLEVVHTCSVTNSAAAKSRHAIRKAARRGSESPSNRGSRLVSAPQGMNHEATPGGSH
ncbi:MAG: hypothetical protein O7G85_05585, partial [Planctomycetota bacterium]|nr:hypothetical protein [Planctomycetota bacterium]